MLVDTAGNDVYRSKSTPGTARYDKRFDDREALSTYWTEASSLGLFLDLDGTDDYGDRDLSGRTWGDEPGSDNQRVANRGVGRDAEGGSISWDLEPGKGRR